MISFFQPLSPMCFSRDQWTTNSALAVSTGAADRRSIQGCNPVDWWWRGIPADESRCRCTAVGSAQVQAGDELREASSCSAILLRRRHDCKGSV